MFALGSRVEGSLLVVEARVSVSTANQTLEATTSRMRRSHIQLVDQLQRLLTEAGAPLSALTAISAVRQVAARRDPEWYNDVDRFAEATKNALESTREVLNALGREETWQEEVAATAVASAAVAAAAVATADDDASWTMESPSPGAARGAPSRLHTASGGAAHGRSIFDRMVTCAELATRMGNIGAALALLRHAMGLAPHSLTDAIDAAIDATIDAAITAVPTSDYDTPLDATALVRWKVQAAQHLISLGAPAPWPDVIAALAAGAEAVGFANEELDDRARAATARAIATLATELTTRPRATTPGIRAHAGFKVTSPARPKSSGPFEVGAQVLVFDEEAVLRGRWRPARISRVLKAGGGYECCTNGWKRLSKVEIDKVLEVQHSGAGAVLRAAAAWHGCEPLICSLLQSRASVAKSADEHACTALHAAASAGCAENARLLLEAGASATLVDAFGRSSLRRAFERCQRSVIQVLAQPDMASQVYPLVAAMHSGDASAADAALAAIEDAPPQLDGSAPLGFNLALRDVHSEALVAVSRLGDTRLVSLLLLKQACVNAVAQGEPALLAAAMFGHYQACELLIHSRAALDSVDADGFTALLRACEGGHVRVVDRLLAANATLQAVGKGGETPFSLSCKWGHAPVVSTLLRAKALPDECDHKGWPALLRAAQGGWEDVVALLLSARGNVKAVTPRDGLTALHCAARDGHVRVVRQLLEAGASKDARDKGGRTPLFHASKSGDPVLCKVLIAAGCQTDLGTSTGMTSLAVASSLGHVMSVTLLLTARAAADLPMDDGTTALYRTVGSGGACSVECVKLLLEAGASANVVSNEGVPLLVRLCDYSRFSHKTPVLPHHVQLLELILSAKADVGAPQRVGDSFTGWSALQVACAQPVEGIDEMIAVLIKHGADYTASVPLSRGLVDRSDERLAGFVLDGSHALSVAFATIGASWAAARGAVRFEVELISLGRAADKPSLQIGWAKPDFKTDLDAVRLGAAGRVAATVAPDSAVEGQEETASAELLRAEDAELEAVATNEGKQRTGAYPKRHGVGDDDKSWAADGLRGLLFHGSQKSKGAAWAVRWENGDVIGAAVDTESRLISFARNGEWSAAFQDIDLGDGPIFYPAVSLSKGLVIRINLGERPFAFPPPRASYRAPCMAMASPSPATASIALAPLKPPVNADHRLEALRVHKSVKPIGSPLPSTAIVPGCTSLHLAALYGLSATVHLLLDGGAPPDFPRADGSTPLHLACCRG